MKRLFGFLVVVFALAIGTGTAMADNWGGGGGGASNTSTQSATVAQQADSTATATNGLDIFGPSGGNGSETSATAVASNSADIDQTAKQTTSGGSNTSTQTADLSQGAKAVASAFNTGNWADTSAKAKSDNDAWVDQSAYQYAPKGTTNDSSQSLNGFPGYWTQWAGSLAIAANAGWCADTDAFSGSFNNLDLDQLAKQLAGDNHKKFRR